LQNSTLEPSPPRYASHGSTHPGLLRGSNQDSFIERPEAGLWAVADGMGGYSDGDVASRMACDAIASVPAGLSMDETIAATARAIGQVNSKLFKAATRTVDPVVSGTTIVVFIAQRDACVVLWAGDSRLYRLRRGKLEQVTTDHTVAAELNLGAEAEEADHAITRAVGGGNSLTLDARRNEVEPGDRYLLCSDGLTRELSDEEIAVLLAKGDLEQSALTLVAATLRAGARDNVTVLVIEAS
jgi:serine/threonine protein phosphatase PrpC